MRDRWAIAIAVYLVFATDALAQFAPAVPDEVPGLVLPIDSIPLPNGATVSQPLQPVADAPPFEFPTVVASEPSSVRAASLPSHWYSGELLLWWPKGQPTPPLVMAGRTPITPPLIGGSSLPSPDTAGGRFVLGWSLSQSGNYGFEATYFFLGTNTTSAAASKPYGGRTLYLGRPVVNADGGQEDVLLIAGPGQAGDVGVFASTRVQGWEANLIRTLYDGPTVRLNALAGYRYFMVNEGLRVASRTVTEIATMNVADQFDAHNRFHGGQLGLRADVSRGSFFAEISGKIGFGRTVEVVRVSGESVLTAGGTMVSAPFGGLGQPSNTGRNSRAAFAVLPEGGIRVGWRLGESSRVFIGYTLAYLSDAVRPGDQIDRGVELLPGGTGVHPSDRPAPLFVHNDFWVQGLTLGLEWRY